MYLNNLLALNLVVVPYYVYIEMNLIQSFIMTKFICHSKLNTIFFFDNKNNEKKNNHQNYHQ